MKVGQRGVPNIRRLNPHAVEFIRENAAKMSSSKIAKELHVHPSTVRDYKNLLGLHKCLTTVSKPEGTVIVTPNGYQRIKHNGKWVLMQRYVWEQAHGTIPIDCVVKFKDGDKSNCDLSNLFLSRKYDHANDNQIWNYPKEITSAIFLNSKLKRKIREQHINSTRGTVPGVGNAERQRDAERPFKVKGRDRSR